MLIDVAKVIVLLAACFLLLLAAGAFFVPARVRSFLMGFASTAPKHYLELALRFLVGGAFVIAAPQMIPARSISVVGWVIVATTIGLALVPWQLHRRFATRVVPVATRHMWVLGLGSLAAGLAIVSSLALA